MIDPTTLPNSVGGGTSTGRLNNIDKNYEDFLVLLTTQLKNQDPSEPTDTNQLTQQIATLSQVEQQLKTNEQLGQLVSMYQATQYNSIVSYIGKKIEAEGDVGELKTGQATFNYNLSAAASSVTLTVRDAAGNLVRTVQNVPRSAGNHSYVWDGQDNQGNVAPAGTYTLSVEAQNNSGGAIPSTGGQATLAHTKPEYVYYLAKEASSLTITIKDQNGGVIRRDTTSGTRLAGRNSYIWDGKDNNGNPMPEGTYKIEVSAKDAQNQDITSRIFMTGVVSSIDSVDGQAFLSIGDIAIPLERVTSIRLAS
jgi:flagellar basal-body rod modification protein FlgD